MGKKKCLIFSALISAVMLTGTLAGCGTGASTDTSSKPEKKDVTITYVGSQNWLNKGSTIDQDLIDAFTKETGIKVDLQVIPDDQYANVLKTKLTTGQAPDIFMVGAGAGAMKYLPEKYFADLSNEEWVSRYQPYAKAGTTINGKVMGLMTWNVDGWGLLYNTDMYSKFNLTVPKNFDELVKVCDTLKSNNITPVYETGKEAWHWAIWLSQMGPFAAKNNAGLYDKLNSNQMKLADVKEFETFLTQFKQMYDKGYFGTNSISNPWDAGYEAMGTGKGSSYLAYGTYQKEVAEKYKDSKADTWKMYPIPLAGNNMYSHSAGGNMRVAYKNSKNLDAVKKFFNFLTKPENLKKYYAGRTDLQSNPSFKDVEGKPTAAGSSIVENATGGDGIDLEYGILYWDNTQVGKYIQEMMLGAKTPKQVLEAIDGDRAKMFSATSK